MCAVLDTPFETFDNLDFEDRIHRAYEESIEQQTCLPLIKQELQCKIQCDRLSRGESELVLGEEPPKSFEVHLSMADLSILIIEMSPFKVVRVDLNVFYLVLFQHTYT